LVALAIGYIGGAALVSQLPGPYWDGPTSLAIRLTLAFGLPTAGALMAMALSALRRRDRLRANDPHGDAVFDAILLRVVGLVVVLHVLVVAGLAGFLPGAPNPARYVIGLLGVALVLVGDLIPRVRPNLVIGVRTDRTLEDATVWARTHRAAGYGLVAVGGVMAAAACAPGPLIPVIVIPCLAGALVAVFATYRRALIGASALVLVPSVAFAQALEPRLGIADALKARYAEMKVNLLEQAARMPEDGFAFRPTQEVRTFGEVLAHTADTQFLACSNLRGVPNPMAGGFSLQESSKAGYLKALGDSFALCDDVVDSLTDESAIELVQQGPVRMPRLSVLYFLISHNAEMYGVGTVYLRLNGLVPPSTERENARRRAR
jgi:uncharacterized membrane protein/uncharacterized damage-inducible protein DinB